MNKQIIRRLEEVVEEFENQSAGIYFFQPARDEEGNALLDEYGDPLFSPSTSANVYTLKEIGGLEERYPDSIFLLPAKPLDPEDDPTTFVGMTPEDLYAENEEGTSLFEESEETEGDGGSAEEGSAVPATCLEPPYEPCPLTEITDFQREVIHKLKRMQKRSRERGRKRRR